MSFKNVECQANFDANEGTCLHADDEKSLATTNEGNNIAANKEKNLATNQDQCPVANEGKNLDSSEVKGITTNDGKGVAANDETCITVSNRGELLAENEGKCLSANENKKVYAAVVLHRLSANQVTRLSAASEAKVIPVTNKGVIAIANRVNDTVSASEGTNVATENRGNQIATKAEENVNASKNVVKGIIETDGKAIAANYGRTTSVIVTNEGNSLVVANEGRVLVASNEETTPVAGTKGNYLKHATQEGTGITASHNKVLVVTNGGNNFPTNGVNGPAAEIQGSILHVNNNKVIDAANQEHDGVNEYETPQSADNQNMLDRIQIDHVYTSNKQSNSLSSFPTMMSTMHVDNTVPIVYTSNKQSNAGSNSSSSFPTMMSTMLVDNTVPNVVREWRPTCMYPVKPRRALSENSGGNSRGRLKNSWTSDDMSSLNADEIQNVFQKMLNMTSLAPMTDQVQGTTAKLAKATNSNQNSIKTEKMSPQLGKVNLINSDNLSSVELSTKSKSNNSDDADKPKPSDETTAEDKKSTTKDVESGVVQQDKASDGKDPKEKAPDSGNIEQMLTDTTNEYIKLKQQQILKKTTKTKKYKKSENQRNKELKKKKNVKKERADGAAEESQDGAEKVKHTLEKGDNSEKDGSTVKAESKENTTDTTVSDIKCKPVCKEEWRVAQRSAILEQQTNTLLRCTAELMVRRWGEYLAMTNEEISEFEVSSAKESGMAQDAVDMLEDKDRYVWQLIDELQFF